MRGNSFIIRAGCFTIVVFLMSCHYYRSLALYRGGWSVVCYCGFPGHTHLLFVNHSAKK